MEKLSKAFKRNFASHQIIFSCDNQNSGKVFPPNSAMGQIPKPFFDRNETNILSQIAFFILRLVEICDPAKSKGLEKLTNKSFVVLTENNSHPGLETVLSKWECFFFIVRTSEPVLGIGPIFS